MTKKSTKRCGKHTFRLRGNADVYFKGQVTVEFVPVRKSKGIVHRSITPTFQTDGKYYTPAFGLPALVANANEQQMLQEHNKRLLESEEISNILVPKPRSKNMYCGICKAYYQGYLDHIQSELHAKCIQKSLFQGFIKKHCEKFATHLSLQKGTEGIKMAQEHNNWENYLAKSFSCETTDDILKNTQQPAQ